MEKSKRFAAPEAAIRLWFWLFAAAALIAAVCMPDRGQMFAGLGRLCVLPYQSANPYFAAENGGFAGTFLNVALVCAICAAPTVFGKLGLLKGRKAICYPGMEDQLTGADVTYESAVRDGNIITSRGMGTAIDFGLAILTYFEGEQAATALAKTIVYEA